MNDLELEQKIITLIWAVANNVVEREDVRAVVEAMRRLIREEIKIAQQMQASSGAGK